jgi:hypothetical protein
MERNPCVVILTVATILFSSCAAVFETAVPTLATSLTAVGNQNAGVVGQEARHLGQERGQDTQESGESPLAHFFESGNTSRESAEGALESFLQTGASVIDPRLVGTWQLKVPSPAGEALWIWEVRANGTYNFHIEGIPGFAAAHSGRIRAKDGRWNQQSNGKEIADGGTYEVIDANRIRVTGTLGTAIWQRKTSASTAKSDDADDTEGKPMPWGEWRHAGQGVHVRFRKIENEPGEPPDWEWQFCNRTNRKILFGYKASYRKKGVERHINEVNVISLEPSECPEGSRVGKPRYHQLYDVDSVRLHSFQFGKIITS